MASPAMVALPAAAPMQDQPHPATPAVVGEQPGDQVGRYRLLQQITHQASASVQRDSSRQLLLESETPQLSRA